MEYTQILALNEKLKEKAVGVQGGKKYVEVKNRVDGFRSICPNGSIITEIIELKEGKCIIKATVFDDEGHLLGTGHAYEIEGSNYINTSSFLENCETSAVGRALANAGIGIDVAIASYEEVANAKLQQQMNEPIKPHEAIALGRRFKNEGVSTSKVLSIYGVETLADLKYKYYDNILKHWEKVKECCFTED